MVKAPRLPVGMDIVGDKEIQAALQHLKTTAVSAFDGITRSAAGTNQALDAQARNYRRQRDQLNSMVKEQRRLNALVAGAYTRRAIDGAVNYLDLNREIAGSLQLVSEGENRALLTRRKLNQLAKETRSELAVTAKLYSRIGLADADLAAQEDRLLRITGLISKLTRLSPSTAVSRTAGLQQLGQGFESGLLAGDELKSVRENLPAVARALSIGMFGEIDIGRLREAGAAGEITFERMIEAIEKTGAATDEAFKTLPVKLREALSQINNALTTEIDQFDRVTGFSDDLAKGLLVVAENMDGTLEPAAQLLAALLAFSAANLVIGKVVQGTASLGGAIKAAQADAFSARARIAAEGAALAAAEAKLKRFWPLGDSTQLDAVRKQQREVEALRTSYAKLVVEQGRATSVSRNFGASVLGFFGGVSGILTTLPSLAIAAVTAFSLFDDQLTGSTDRLDKFLEKLKVGLEDLNALSTNELKEAQASGVIDLEAANRNVDQASSPLISGLRVLLSAARPRLKNAFYRTGDNQYLAIIEEIKSLIADLEAGNVAGESLFVRLNSIFDGAPFLSKFKKLNNFGDQIQTLKEALAEVERLEQAKAAVDTALDDRAKEGGTTLTRAELRARAERKADNKKDADAVAKKVDALRDQNTINQMILSGKREEAEIERVILAAKRSAKRADDLDVSALRDELQIQQDIAAALENQKKQSREKTRFNQSLDSAKEEAQITDLILAGRQEDADLLREKFMLQRQFPGLSEEELSPLQEALVANRARAESLKDQNKERREAIKQEEELANQREGLQAAVDVARQEAEINKLLLEGRQEDADLLRQKFDLQKRFPNLASDELATLVKQLKLTKDQTLQLQKQTRERQEQRQRAEELSRTIFDAITDRGQGLEDAVEQIFMRGASNGLSEALETAKFNPIQGIEGLFGSLFDSDPAKDGIQGSFSGVLGALSGDGNAFDGILKSINSFGAELGFATEGLGSLTQVVGDIGANAVFVGQVAGMFGLDQTGASIASAVGQAAGTYLGGEIGGVIGQILGGLAGGLAFGDGKDPTAGTTIGVGANGALEVISDRTRGSIDQEASGNLASAVLQALNDIVSATGGTLAEGALIGEIGQFKDRFFFDPTADGSDGIFGKPNKDPDTQLFDSADAAVRAAIVNFISSGMIEGLTPQSIERLSNITSTTLETTLNDVAAFENLRRSIEEGILDLENPLVATLERIADEMREAEALYGRQGADFLDAQRYFMDQQQAAIDAYREEQIGSLLDLRSDLLSGSAAGLSPIETLEEQRANLADLTSRLDAGETLDATEVEQVLSDFVDASSAVNARTGTFFADRDQAVALLDRVVDAADARIETAVADSMITLVSISEDQTRLQEDQNDILSEILNAIQAGNGLSTVGIAGISGGGLSRSGGSFSTSGDFEVA